jgi:hypothetical protein
MADETTSEAVELDANGEPKRNFRRVLEDRAETAEAKVAELEARVSGFLRDTTFRDAGIDMTDSRQQYFIRGYDGEMDAESIRVAAVEAGFISDSGPTTPGVPLQQGSPEIPQETPTLQQELMAQDRIANAGAQSRPVTPPDLNSQIQATTSQEQLQALMESQGYTFNVQG